jgi:hypothetical protein
MTAPTKLPHPADARPLPRRGATPPPRSGSPSAGASSPFPLIGDQVRFQRSPTHHPEPGIVRARIFGTRAIEIVDMEGKPLRLDAGQYQTAPQMPAPTPGRQSPPAPPPTKAGGDTDTFHCPEWPRCGCPDGTMRVDCPGLKKLRMPG